MTTFVVFDIKFILILYYIYPSFHSGLLNLLLVLLKRL